jgi:hypothetical protein
MKTKHLLAIAALALASCEKHESAATAPTASDTAALDAYFTADPIADPQAIHVARTTAKPGDKIVIKGLVMGREKVFVDGRASFLLGDREKLTPCNEMPGDECPTPWDACCDSKEAKREGIASIQIVGEDGRVISGSLKGTKGLKELSAVTVTGTVAEQSTPDALIVNATKIHVGER